MKKKRTGLPGRFFRNSKPCFPSSRPAPVPRKLLPSAEDRIAVTPCESPAPSRIKFPTFLGYLVAKASDMPERDFIPTIFPLEFLTVQPARRPSGPSLQ